MIGASRYQKLGSHNAECPLSPQGVSSAADLVTGGPGCQNRQILILISGGKLALYEITQDKTRAGFVFGLLPGWWLSTFQALSLVNHQN